MAKLNEPYVDESRDHLGFERRRARIGRHLGAFERRPEGGGLYTVFRMADGVDYHEGEEARR